MSYRICFALANTCFAPEFAGCPVLVYFEASNAPGSIMIETGTGVSTADAIPVLRKLATFLESDQFRQLDFETGSMLVEFRDRSDAISLVSASQGFLRDDGIIEFMYPPPHK